PRRAKTNPIRACAEAVRVSIGRGSGGPAAPGAPFVAGRGGVRQVENAGPEPAPGGGGRVGGGEGAGGPGGGVEGGAPRGEAPPAQKPRPAPVTMIARMSSSASARRKASSSSTPMVPV